jgi:hypothetical protein
VAGWVDECQRQDDSRWFEHHAVFSSPRYRGNREDRASTWLLDVLDASMHPYMSQHEKRRSCERGERPARLLVYKYQYRRGSVGLGGR